MPVKINTSQNKAVAAWVDSVIYLNNLENDGQSYFFTETVTYIQ